MIPEEREVDAALAALREEPELAPASEVSARVLERLERGIALAPSGEGGAGADASGTAFGAAAPVAHVTAIALAFSLGAAAGVGAMAFLRAPNERVVHVTEKASVASVPVVVEAPRLPNEVEASSSASKAPPPAMPLRPAPVLRSSAGPLAGGAAREDQQELLDRARIELNGGDGARALASLELHRRRFPTTWLEEERQALRIRALVAVGRRAEALRVYGEFARRFAQSPLLSPLQATFAKETVTESQGERQ
jgi:hypothetical protein